MSMLQTHFLCLGFNSFWELVEDPSFVLKTCFVSRLGHNLCVNLGGVSIVLVSKPICLYLVVMVSCSRTRFYFLHGV